jgi:hypothetical protein
MKTRKMPKLTAPVDRTSKVSASVNADAISASNYGGDASGGVAASLWV